MLRGGVALIVAVLLVGGGAGVSLAQYGGKPEASKLSPATTTGGDVKEPAETVKTVTGKIKSVEPTRLVVKSSGKTPKEYTFELAGTAIKVGKKEGTSTDLKVGNAVRVTYTDSGGKLIAKTVIAKPVKAKR
jgi:hypothetical protein